MKTPFFILITGSPCTGKTTLGKKVAEYFDLPYIGKDTIKESLFNSLGWNDRNWSQKVGIASIELLYIFLESNLIAKKSIVIENAFITEYERPKLINIIQKFNSDCIEVHCFTDKDILLKRFEDRDKSGTRHIGHIQQEAIIELKKRLDNNSYGRLDLNNKVILVDTTDFNTISTEFIIHQIHEYISKK